MDQKIDLNFSESFEPRHNSLSQEDVQEMLQIIGKDSLEQLMQDTVPASIRLNNELNLPQPKNPYEYLQDLAKTAGKNQVYRSFIGMGYYDCYLPHVIQRNILENPGWYTAYTPYQAEIAQGRMEALINFQTAVIDLTGMEIANASLLDESTAAAEAMTMLLSLRKKDKKKSLSFFVSEQCLPQTIDVLKTRALPLGINLIIGNHQDLDILQPDLFGMLLQYPAGNGEVYDYTALIQAAQEAQVYTAVAADLLSLTILKSPGEMGADVVLGTAQRFGVPMGYGGPHAAYFATKEAFKRQMPGRIIGVSLDKEGNKAYRMALQTREQHIRREKATSNICTAQVLLAVIAGAYAVFHGPERLRLIAEKIWGLTHLSRLILEKMGLKVVNERSFDTLTFQLENEAQLAGFRKRAEARKMNFRYDSDHQVGISFDEVKSLLDVKDFQEILEELLAKKSELDLEAAAQELQMNLPSNLIRTSDYLNHPVFNTYHSEHAMLRYLKSLENKDLSLVHSMIPLGSCTMKLNASTEMMPLSWAEFGQLHPFAPIAQTQGYQDLFKDLEAWLCEITGFAAISFQPNSGAQGEYTGLMTIRNYHLSNGDAHRNISLIPSSAHGTNPASAVMSGMKVVVVNCDEKGNIDLEDLKAKVEKHSQELSSLMVTYPSTHGVFEDDIREICDLIHQHGGLVYMDGANMNAQVGLTSPGQIGADVCHLNLHKTFCIPHGGGGPGMGPIGVVERLIPHLPNHSQIKISDHNNSAVSAAPWGSASILTISHAYIAMMGSQGLKNATQQAILNANYLMTRLQGHYEVLFTGSNGTCAHEFIIDCRSFKTVGVEVSDIAKRLMDYGFHAPTVSFPVAGTMMIEPTESENKDELDRFCEALIGIRNEIKEIEEGRVEPTNNVVVNAPHTAAMLLKEDWAFPYSREKAAYPLAYLKNAKFWPTAAKIDNAYGDRNLICSCIPIEQYMEPELATEKA